MRFIFNDGGRALAGFKGQARDCVCRSVAIASGRPYAEVYAALAKGMGTMRRGRGSLPHKATARDGIFTNRKWFKDYMASLGFVWKATMTIGSGCKVHLRESELPAGRLVVAVSRHYTAVIDGVIHDTHDPQRLAIDCAEADKADVNGSRCVYGYWIYNPKKSDAMMLCKAAIGCAMTSTCPHSQPHKWQHTCQCGCYMASYEHCRFFPAVALPAGAETKGAVLSRSETNNA